MERADGQINSPEGEGPSGAPGAESHARAVGGGEVRLLRPQRSGVVRVPCDLDRIIPADHRARAIWAVVEKLDMSGFEAGLRARGSQAGRPAIDRRILVALWIYGGMEGVYEARELDRLCRQHMGYLWICGGVSVDYHVLAEFRVGHGEALDGLLSQVHELLKKGHPMELARTAQDGMRVRASAGAASFHREATVQKHLEEARKAGPEVQQRQEGSAGEI